MGLRFRNWRVYHAICILEKLVLNFHLCIFTLIVAQGSSDVLSSFSNRNSRKQQKLGIHVSTVNRTIISVLSWELRAQRSCAGIDCPLQCHITVLSQSTRHHHLAERTAGKVFFMQAGFCCMQSCTRVNVTTMLFCMCVFRETIPAAGISW